MKGNEMLYKYTWEQKNKQQMETAIMTKEEAYKTAEYLTQREVGASRKATYTKGYDSLCKFVLWNPISRFKATIQQITEKQARRLIQSHVAYSRAVQIFLFPNGEDLTAEEWEMDERVIGNV